LDAPVIIVLVRCGQASTVITDERPLDQALQLEPVMTVMNPNSKIVEQDPATWKGLLFRIFDAPSRSLCVLTMAP